MVFYLKISKMAKKDGLIAYSYTTADERSGSFTISKETDETQLISIADGEIELRFYSRAAHKIRQHWQRGELPEMAVWAS